MGVHGLAMIRRHILNRNVAPEKAEIKARFFVLTLFRHLMQKFVP